MTAESFDVGGIVARLENATADMVQRAKAGLFDGAGLLLEESQRRVPLDEGTLQNSGHPVQSADGLTCAVVYNTPYAVPQHERLDYQHPNGREAKYLENAMNDAGTRARIRAAIVARMGG